MTFLIAQRYVDREGAPRLRATQERFCLAGWQLLHKFWKSQDCPVNVGWHATQDALLRLHNHQYSAATHAMIIDIDPRSRKRIGVSELVEVYGFSYRFGHEVDYTPVMMRMRDVYWPDLEPDQITEQFKNTMFEALPEPQLNAKTSISFAYMNGNAGSWNWGGRGLMNGALLYGDALIFFKANM